MKADTSTNRVVWVADTKSLLSRLEPGPLKAPDRATAEIWAQLDELGRYGVSVLATFVYSHVGTPYNAEADALAERDDFTPGPAPQLWWADHAAAEVREINESHDAKNRGSEQSGRLRFLYAPAGPTLYCGSVYEHMVAQLRTGVCGRWGGWAHDDRAVNCPLCGEAKMQRGGRAIEHLFACDVDLAQRLRRRRFGDEAPISPEVLWRRPADAAFYASALCNAAYAAAGTSAGVTDDESESDHDSD